MINARNFYINGQWVPPLASRNLDVLNPATEQKVEQISLAGSEDVNRAVLAAKDAFKSWSQTSKQDRLNLLKAILTQYRARSQDLAEAMTLEMGAPEGFALTSQAACGEHHIEAFIRVLESFKFEEPVTANDSGDTLFLEPIGVCGLITPWNWPMNQITLKVIPALAAGCTMVLKPSEESPLSALVFAEIMHDAGVPAGVFNLINGDGAGAGAALTSHPDVHMVSFTGSTRAGTQITQSAASTIKRVALELGGKGANIIFSDAAETAVSEGVALCMENTGQSCNAPTRMLVERSRYDAAVAEAAEAAQRIKAGMPSDPQSDIGPVINERQFDAIQAKIKAAIAEGARLVAGGPGRPDDLKQGYFIKPTVFADCTADMSIMQQEVFGPVLAMMPFDTEEEAIALANSTPYGLTNYIQTTDRDRARRVAHAVRSGTVEINYQFCDYGTPFGGVGYSGNGREGGVEGLREFLEVKAVAGL